MKPKKAKIENTKTEKSVNKPKKSTKHFRHERLSQEDVHPENRYYKRNKHPTVCQCWNCGEIGNKSIDCTKRKANIVKLFTEEFNEIQHELYPLTFEHSNILLSFYESISSNEDSILDTSDSSSISEHDY